MDKITVKDIDVRYKKIDTGDFICLTDIARYKNPEDPRFILSCTAGCGIRIRSSFSDFRRSCTIPILTVSNSIRLKTKPGSIPL